jgi:hypothetical protein
MSNEKWHTQVQHFLTKWTPQHMDVYLAIPEKKWQWNGLLSLVRLYLTCAASLYAVWGGSHMVCEISLALPGNFKVSIANNKK